MTATSTAWLERDRVAAGGPRFRFREVAVVPRPATRPRPPVVVAATVAQVADTTPEAQACLRAAMPPWLQRGVGEYVSIAAAPRLRRDPRAYVEHLLQIHPVGTPERCAERLAASAERTGVRRFLLMVEGSGDHGRALENIARIGTEVAPRLDQPRR